MRAPPRPVQPSPQIPRTRPQIQSRAVRLGDLVQKTLDPVVKKRGFASTRLLADWETVVGARIAGLGVPEALKFSRGRDAGGTLLIGCTSGDALDLQHLQPQLIERVNAYLGWRAVEAVRLQTGRRRPARSPAREGTLKGGSQGQRNDATSQGRLGTALARWDEGVRKRTSDLTG